MPPKEGYNDVFDMMVAAADKTDVDIMAQADTDLNKYPEWVQEETLEDVENWNNFINALDVEREGKKELGLKEGMSIPRLDPFQRQYLKDLWVEGGRPKIHVIDKDNTNPVHADRRASYSSSLRYIGTGYEDLEGGDHHRLPQVWRDQIDNQRSAMWVYEGDLFDDYMAEIAHANKYARKPGENRRQWLARANKLRNEGKEEKENFGDKARYGKYESFEDALPGEDIVSKYDEAWGSGTQVYDKINDKRYVKTFPFMSKQRFEWKKLPDGTEVIVDSEGNVRDDMTGPADDVRNITRHNDGRWGWSQFEMDHAAYHPSTRMGLTREGEWVRPSREFEAHSIIEDSLLERYHERELFDDYDPTKINPWWIE